ncbi:Phage tail protein [Parageobacillus thermantarcticus]|uniref:Phage tail protein n=1 Tax=Parageobacillus thermantarcticus TaxID=186116 RepID=A0A1I0TGM7_9BACL|nr:phage tail domain-containing protein [Parageobacillus thermantarcticus]SFA50914.1 Phage tail protein [Parageobacillus thermantarcticus]
MKSPLNFVVKKGGNIYDMHELGIWVSSFHIYSPNLNRNKLTVPGRRGAYLVNTQEDERHVRIVLQIETDSMQEFDALKHTIFDLFYSEEAFSIIRDITPDKEIFVMQEGEFDIENISDSDGEFEITLTMLDPYIYGPEKEAVFPSDVVSLNYKGTAPGDPIFDLEVLKPVTFALIQNQNDEYMMIGKPVNVDDQVPVEREQRIFWSHGDTLVGWTTGSNIDGTVAGTMASNGYKFYPINFGTGSGSWHGPAMKTSLPQVLEHFRVDAIVEFFNSAPSVGRLEIYLLAEDGDVISKIALRDTTPSRAATYGEARVGNAAVNYYMFNDTGATPSTWTNFFGMLRIGRYNDEWFAYIAKIDQTTGEHTARMYRSWRDTEGQFRKNLAQIQVHFGQLSSYTPITAMGIHDIKVFKWNPITQSEIPYIAREGDVITFDHKEKNILINGESHLDLKDFGARFFKLKPGENILTVYPEQSFNVTCRYRERFK